MFFDIDYAQRAAERDHRSNVLLDEDFDYEQLFDETDLPPESSKIEQRKPVKRVRFASTDEQRSPSPVLSRPASVRPTFDLEFDFDSLSSPAEPLPKSNTEVPWKNAFLQDLNTAKKNSTLPVSSPNSNVTTENNAHQDTLWDFMKRSNPTLLEKLERTSTEKQKRIDRLNEITEQKSLPSNISIIEIRLEYDQYNQVHEELLRFLIPYHKVLCEEKIWPEGFDMTSPNTSLQLIRNICENEDFSKTKSIRSEILRALMFIHTITSFLYVFAYCSLQTAIRHVENVIVQNMRYVCIDQARGEPLFHLLTKTHEKFENILHPKIAHVKSMLINFFEQRRQWINQINSIPEPKFLLLVQYESFDLLDEIERSLSSILELRSIIYEKNKSLNRDELNELFVYYNLLIVRTRQISPTIVQRPKRLTLVIEYEYTEHMAQWYQFCCQHNLAYLAYQTVLPAFAVSNDPTMEIDPISMETKEEPFTDDFIESKLLPTIILARPLVDNFKLLRTLECRHDLTIITRDYHSLGIPTDQQPDILIDWMTSMLILDLNTKLDINIVQKKIQSITLHSCRIHVAILTSGSIPDFILSTYITPISHLAKVIQENKTAIDIQIKSFSSLEEFANHVAHLAQGESMMKFVWSPTPSWNEKMLLRRCSSLNSLSAQLILQRLINVDLSTITADLLIEKCPEIPSYYLKAFLFDMHRTN